MKEKEEKNSEGGGEGRGGVKVDREEASGGGR